MKKELIFWIVAALIATALALWATSREIIALAAVLSFFVFYCGYVIERTFTIDPWDESLIPSCKKWLVSLMFYSINVLPIFNDWEENSYFFVVLGCFALLLTVADTDDKLSLSGYEWLEVAKSIALFVFLAVLTLLLFDFLPA